MNELLPVKSPKEHRLIKAVIKHENNWRTDTVDLALEGDGYYFNDRCKLSHEWNVIYWEYIASPINVEE